MASFQTELKIAFSHENGPGPKQQFSGIFGILMCDFMEM